MPVHVFPRTRSAAGLLVCRSGDELIAADNAYSRHEPHGHAAFFSPLDFRSFPASLRAIDLIALNFEKQSAANGAMRFVVNAHLPFARMPYAAI